MAIYVHLAMWLKFTVYNIILITCHFLFLISGLVRAVVEGNI